MSDYQTYLVGGAVRDQLLNRTVKDRDWVVVGATPDELLAEGYRQVGADFPVFLHPSTKEEYALARTERKTGRGYQGFVCDSSPDIPLEEDLKRRDLTINAIAMDEQNNLIDPFDGQADLEARTLRHVSPAFNEDPLRILRVARFAARFESLGFTVADETLELMKHMTSSGEANHLTAERVWQETERALSEPSPWVYFEILRNVGALAIIFPEIDALFGVPQPEKYHPEVDCGIHALLSLQQACYLSQSCDVRFAALIHDLGKALTPSSNWPAHHGHEKAGLKPIKALCERLRAPKSYRNLALLLSEYHTHIHRASELKDGTFMKVFKACDAFRQPERFEKILLGSIADARGRTGLEETPYPQADEMRRALQACQELDTTPLLDAGYTGKALGQKIDQERLSLIHLAREAT